MPIACDLNDMPWGLCRTRVLPTLSSSSGRKFQKSLKRAASEDAPCLSGENERVEDTWKKQK